MDINPNQPKGRVIDLTQIEISDHGPKAPAGRYNVEISKMSLEPLFVPEDGEKIAVQFKILDGSYKGSVIFVNYNAFHKKNADTARIAFEQIAKLGMAIKETQLFIDDGFKNFLHKKLTIITEVDEKYTTVKGYFELESNAQTQSVNPSNTVGPAIGGPKTAIDLPWLKK